jgi:hypothetical protein
MTTGVYPLATYYPLSLGSKWHYTAPPRWGGDYIARIEAGPSLPIGDTVRHFDATNAAKVLCYLPLKGLYYLREEFSMVNPMSSSIAPSSGFPIRSKLERK